MLLIASERFEEHVTPPGHPERMERARVFTALARPVGQTRRGQGRPRPATREELARVHDESYLDDVAAIAGRAVSLDADAYTSPESVEIAALALARCRPPSTHDARRDRVRAGAAAGPPHAERDRAMGFCLYNNVAVAAAAARARHRTCRDRGHRRAPRQRVAVDVLRRSGVLYVSSHQFPFYPGTGAAHETGSGAGKGTPSNVPLEAGATDADYQLVHCDRPAGARTVPAGVDPHIRRLRRPRTGPACVDADVDGRVRRDRGGLAAWRAPWFDGAGHRRGYDRRRSRRLPKSPRRSRLPRAPTGPWSAPAETRGGRRPRGAPVPEIRGWIFA